jgi:hypothetical protein
VPGAVDPVDAGEQTNGQLNARNAARSLPAAEVELWDRSVPHRRTRRRARHRRVVVPHRDPAADWNTIYVFPLLRLPVEADISSRAAFVTNHTSRHGSTLASSIAGSTAPVSIDQLTGLTRRGERRWRKFTRRLAI